MKLVESWNFLNFGFIECFDCPVMPIIIICNRSREFSLFYFTRHHLVLSKFHSALFRVESLHTLLRKRFEPKSYDTKHIAQMVICSNAHNGNTVKPTSEMIFCSRGHFDLLVYLPHRFHLKGYRETL